MENTCCLLHMFLPVHLEPRFLLAAGRSTFGADDGNGGCGGGFGANGTEADAVVVFQVIRGLCARRKHFGKLQR